MDLADIKSRLAIVADVYILKALGIAAAVGFVDIIMRSGMLPDSWERGWMTEIVVLGAVLGAVWMIIQKGIVPIFRGAQKLQDNVEQFVEKFRLIDQHSEKLDRVYEKIDRLFESVNEVRSDVERLDMLVKQQAEHDAENFAAIVEWSRQFKQFEPISVDLKRYRDD